MRQSVIAGLCAGVAIAIAGPAIFGDAPGAAQPDKGAPTVPFGPTAEFPPDWVFNGDQPARLASLRRLDGTPAPELAVGSWLVGEPRTMESMRGKIVVLDFWGTWCGPCLKALPHTNELADRYRDQGVEFIAICETNRGSERAPTVVKQLGLTFPVVLDQGRATYNAFLGQWFPFYVLVDRNGVVRVSGLRPDTIQPAVDRLLIEQPMGSVAMATGTSPLPPAPSQAWMEGTPAQRASLADIEAKPAIPLAVVESSWVNTDPMDLASLRGKVVLLDFWGTWCAPCLQSVPKLNALRERYATEGLVIIGVCHSRDSGKMPKIADEYGISYPIVADTAGATFKAYRVNGTPDYFLIDRAGTIRFADLANTHVEDAIRFLLAEPAPPAPD